MAQTPTNGAMPDFDRNACKTGLICLAMCLLVAIAVFARFPMLDLQTSAYFGDHLSGFSLRPSAAWETVRQAFILITNGAFLSLLACWFALRLRPNWEKNHAHLCRIAGFAALTYALIPGVVVNGIIKPLWGRARPYDVAEFGGAFDFTSPFELGGKCTSACSFVSGETSAVFTCATLVLLFVVPAIAKEWRGPVVAVTLGLALFGSALRIVVGAHFLSDVVFSALLSSALVLMFALRLSAPAQVSVDGQETPQVTRM